MKASPDSIFTVRRMRVEDIDQVMAIAAGLKDAPHWSRLVYDAALDPSAIPRRIALIAANEISGIVAGFAVASILVPQAELELIAVRADAQRQGIGSKLCKFLVDELKAVAVNEILLEVRASNRAARALYESLGWQPTGSRPRYYADPEEDAILMSLALG
jgi:ribosomal-protein-alanine N-acetyltransferase